MTNVLRWLRNRNGSPNWIVIGAFVGIALLAVALWQDGRAADRREQATRSRETAIIADSVAINRYLLDLSDHNGCVTQVNASNAMRAQFLAVNDVIEATPLPIEGLDVLLARLVSNLDKTTPERSVDDCPPLPAMPPLASVGVSLPG